MMKRKSVVFILAALALVGGWVYWAAAGKIHLYEDGQRTEQEILKRIPIGSSIIEAKEIMERNGFQCTMEQEGKTFLYCDKEKFALPLMRKRWQVSIVHRNNKVSKVHVSYGTIEP